MSTDNVDTKRRRFLVASTSVVAAVGAGFVAVPFVSSWMPSERAKNAGAPVEVDISKVPEGRFPAPSISARRRGRVHVVAVESFRPENGICQLVLLGLGLLQADNVRLLARQPVEKSLSGGGANAIGV